MNFALWYRVVSGACIGVNLIYVLGDNLARGMWWLCLAIWFQLLALEKDR
jgi:hypothetical protein